MTLLGLSEHLENRPLRDVSNEPDRIEGAIREQGPYGGKAPGESRVGTLADELELFAT